MMIISADLNVSRRSWLQCDAAPIYKIHCRLDVQYCCLNKTLYLVNLMHTYASDFCQAEFAAKLVLHLC